MGMSWSMSLDKAIWYAAKHAAAEKLSNVAVYAATVDRDGIYCCGEWANGRRLPRTSGMA
jgi:hypothetical protein